MVILSSYLFHLSLPILLRNTSHFGVDCHHSFSTEPNNHDYHFYTVLLLCLSVLEWRQEELAHINATLCGSERKAALCALLEQETKFIASLGCHRKAAGERNQEIAVQAFLNKVLAFYNVLSTSCSVIHTVHFLLWPC